MPASPPLGRQQQRRTPSPSRPPWDGTPTRGPRPAWYEYYRPPHDEDVRSPTPSHPNVRNYMRRIPMAFTSMTHAPAKDARPPYLLVLPTHEPDDETIAFVMHASDRQLPPEPQKLID